MSEKRLLTIEDFMDEYSMSRNATLAEINKKRLKIKQKAKRCKIVITREDAEAWANAL
jgi:hypothetical protein